MGPRHLLAIVAALLMTAPAAVRAQIVNVQPLLATRDAPGLSGSVEGALDWRTGNNDLLLVSASATTSYRTPQHLVFLMGRGELGHSQGDRILDRSLVHLRYRFMPLPRFQPETFVQYDRDEFRRLELRALYGLGPHVPVVSREAIELSLGAAMMIELERVDRDDDSGIVDETLAGRLSTYVALRANVGESLRFAHTLYVQPRAGDPTDLRLLTETELLVKVADHFAIKLAPSLTYDSEPPPGLDPLDTTVKTSLQITW